MKRAICLLIAFALLMVFAPVYTYAAETDEQQEDLTVEFDSSSLDAMFASEKCS